MKYSPGTPYIYFDISLKDKNCLEDTSCVIKPLNVDMPSN